MALTLTHGEKSFGIGDVVRVHQKIEEAEGKFRTQIFEGAVLSISGHGERRTFTVRRVGAAKVGIEQIFPISSPNIEKVEVVREGLKGVTRAKIYYIRDKSTREIEKIYARAKRRSMPVKPSKKVKTKKVAAKKKVVKKSAKVKKVDKKK